MKSESIVFGIAGICFGVILGWVLATQQLGGRSAPTAAPVAATQAAGGTQPAAVLDEGRVRALTTVLESDPKNVKAAVELANVYFDGQRYQDAITWYEQAMKLDPSDVNASTDLGVSYYYSNQPDRALQQFDVSLKIDPRHIKTLLNQGIVLAFGKQDLAAAAASWKKVVDIAPESPEGKTAQQALQGIAAHTGGGTTPGN